MGRTRKAPIRRSLSTKKVTAQVGRMGAMSLGLDKLAGGIGEDWHADWSETTCAESRPASLVSRDLTRKALSGGRRLSKRYGRKR